MGFIQKKDEDKDYLDGIEVIGRGEGPDGDEVFEVELHEGQTAEDISGTTAERAGDLELEADPELLEHVDEFAVINTYLDNLDWGLDGKDDSEGDVDNDAATSNQHPFHNRRPAIFAVLGIIAVIIAGIVGYFVGTGPAGPKGAPTELLSEGQLDTVVATWSYKGASHDVTAREAIESVYGLEQVKDEDGMYPAPSAEDLLTHVRNQIVLADADEQGITVDESELEATAQDSLGTSDYSVIGKKYGVTAEQAKEIIRQQTIFQKLTSTVVRDMPVAPKAPADPTNGDAEALTPEYAEYILGLAGEAWDGETGTWKDASHPIAVALGGSGFDGKTASFEMAQVAHYAAYEEYADASEEGLGEWNAYVNRLFANASIELYGLYA